MIQSPIVRSRRIDPNEFALEIVKNGQCFIETTSSRPHLIVGEIRNRRAVPLLRQANSRAYDEIRSMLFCKFGTMQTARAVDSFVDILFAQARQEGRRIPVFNRIGNIDGQYYLDLANKDGQFVEITSSGWSIKNGPAEFAWQANDDILPLPLPLPKGHGDMNRLRQFINVPDDDSFQLLLGCLLTFLKTTRDLPIILFTGEQGSAKSTSAEYLKRTIDPRRNNRIQLGNKVDDVFISAKNDALPLLDNVTSLSEDVSNAFCVISGGGAISRRTLYEDEGQTQIYAHSGVILTAITRPTERSDFVDRCFQFHTQRIEPGTRRSQAELETQFGVDHPRILTGLLDAFVAGLNRHELVSVTSSHRMKDAVMWMASCLYSTPGEQQSFATLIDRVRSEELVAVVQDNPISLCINTLMRDRDFWTGTPTELYEAITGVSSIKRWQRQTLPNSPSRLSRELAKLAPGLREDGIDIVRDNRTSTARLIRIQRLLPP